MFRLEAFSISLFALGALTAPDAIAQSPYDNDTIRFQMWCQEEAKLPADRCDKRLPQDLQTFQAYRDQLENYGDHALQEKQRRRQTEDDVMRSDPVDNPLSQNPAAQQQLPQNLPR